MTLDIKKDVCLSKHLSMRIEVKSKFLVTVNDKNELLETLKWIENNLYDYKIIGGGSNIIFLDSFYDGVVILMNLDYSRIQFEDSEMINIEVGAGCNWDSFVAKSVKHNWWGIENLSLIPGLVGAVAVQNVGAYGQEVKNVIKSVEAYDTLNKKLVVLNNDDCKFSFRTSIFNSSCKDRFIITSIIFTLSKLETPIVSRKELKEFSNKKYIENRQSEIRGAIIKLRSSGVILPKPNGYGNCGTFFRANELSIFEVPKLILICFMKCNFKLALKIFGCAIKNRKNLKFKMPSKMLIESVFKKYPQYGNVTLFESNPAIVINKSESHNCKPIDIKLLIEEVVQSVKLHTGISVIIEPVILLNNQYSYK